jgi:hypothetical protein
MRSRREILNDLLHSRSEATLATQSPTLSGFPCASALAFGAWADLAAL